MRRTTVTLPRTRAHGVHLHLLFLFFVLVAIPRPALAEKVLAKGDDWQVFTDGRAAGFFSWVYGQGFPQATYESKQDPSDPNSVICTQVQGVKGGGFAGLVDQGPTVNCVPDQGTINSMRVRSGFIGNQLGLGVRAQISPWTTVTGYLQLWAYIESESRQKNRPNPVDVRQGYAKVDSWWGSLTVGRTRALFSRGATDLDALYAHRWGVGWVGGNIDNVGPALGQIGFGVMGSGFAAGMIYGTPALAGFQLDVGLFEPIALYGNGALTRTKYLRPEAQLNYEHKFSDTGKIVLFANGVYQTAYKGGTCEAPTDPDQLGCKDTAAGVGYGGRFEFGPVHLGFAAHYGKGLGTNYALESTDASSDPSGNLRIVDGYFVQSQFVLGRVDLAAGWGINRIHLTNYDLHNPTDSSGIRLSVLKYQMGINASVVYHLRPYLHLDLDYFRAQAKWFWGESQVVHATNAGLTFNW
jgi:hypothetical protein